MHVCYVEKRAVTDSQQARKNSTDWWHVNSPTTALLLFIAVAACAAIHLRAIGGDFLSDDFAHASWVADAQSKGELLEWLVSRLYLPLGSGNFAYRPVVFASYALDWIIYGTNAAGWHLTNLVIHLVNGVLIFVLALVLLSPRCFWLSLLRVRVLSGR
jgi:protein O-mannosyl-transferase